MDHEASLGIDLEYQGFAAELAGLPGAGLRRTPRPHAKRLRNEAPLRRPEARGCQLGRTLAMAIIQAARSIGYAEMRLDTLPSMVEARKLYRSMGLKPTLPYCASAVAETIFLSVDLRSAI